MVGAKKTTLSLAGDRPAWAPMSSAPVVGLRMIGRETTIDVPPGPWTLGTRADQDVVIDDPTVSSQHCAFAWRDGDLWVRDVGSKNGTFVNGAKVSDARLIDGSVLVVGRTTLVAFAESSRGRRSREELLDGKDPKFRIAVDTAIDAAMSGRPVVVVGEDGSGRERLARTIHEIAVGTHLPFVRIGLRPGGVIEAPPEADAPAGTVFVEELAHLPTALYGRIVGLMRRGHIEVEQGQVQGRLQVVVSSSAPLWPSALPDDALQVTLPSLRERGDDVMVLLDRFARDEFGHAGGRRAFGREVLAAIRAYPWPGNVSELKRAIVHLAAICKYGSVRAAADALDMSKSALSDWLYRRGIPTPRK